MIAQMLYAGVDHCILQAGGGYGAMNDYNAFTQSQYPEKFTGLLHIDEAVADRDDVLAEADRAHGARPEGPLLLARFLAPRLRAQPRSRRVPSVLGQDRGVEASGFRRALGDANTN